MNSRCVFHGIVFGANNLGICQKIEVLKTANIKKKSRRNSDFESECELVDQLLYNSPSIIRKNFQEFFLNNFGHCGTSH